MWPARHCAGIDTACLATLPSLSAFAAKVVLAAIQGHTALAELARVHAHIQSRNENMENVSMCGVPRWKVHRLSYSRFCQAQSQCDCALKIVSHLLPKFQLVQSPTAGVLRMSGRYRYLVQTGRLQACTSEESKLVLIVC